MPLSAYTNQPKAEPKFRAGLEVDHFVWPSICAEMAANEHLFDGLAEELIDEAARGNKIIAVSSCRRGEGRTSMLLCVARRLASSGVKVCMVDADLQNPQLGRRLGLAAQAGWESVITGELAVTEVLIDSIDDRLSLFPLKSAAQLESGLSPSQFAIMTGILRDHHDIVLVDTGPLLEGNQSGLHLMEEKSGVEAIVLVSDVQATAPEQVRQAQRLLSAARIKCVGIAENFVQ
jgi:Mrp family chromosome partitioning ATPase